MSRGNFDLGPTDAEPVIGPDETNAIFLEIEAGLLARQARLTGTGFADATAIELRLLEERGEQVRQRFIEANLRLVAMVVIPQAARSRVDDTELFQEGCLGLLRAVERYDARRGIRFSTYAVFWIRAYVSAASARQFGELNLPAGRAEQLRAVRGLEAELAQQLGRAPSVAEVASVLGRPVRWTADLLGHQRPTSLDPLDARHAERAVAVDSEEVDPDELLRLRSLLTRLPRSARRVLALRFGFADGRVHSYAEIAQLLHSSPSSIRRTELLAVERLRLLRSDGERAAS